MSLIRRVTPEDVDDVHTMLCELADYERSLHEVRATADDFRAALFADQPALFGHVVEPTTAAWAGSPCGSSTTRPGTASTASTSRTCTCVRSIAAPASARPCSPPSPRSASSAGLTRLEWWVLDWNEPSIGFYRSIGAESMDEWTVMRVTGTALGELAAG